MILTASVPHPAFRAVIETLDCGPVLPPVHRWRLEVRSLDGWQPVDGWSWEPDRQSADVAASARIHRAERA